VNHSSIRILLIEDNPADADFLQEILIDDKYNTWQIVHVVRFSEAVQHLNQQQFDIILLDLSLPDSQGLETITRAHDIAPLMPIVVLTGLDNEAIGLEALRRGAQDYLIKGQIEYPLLTRAIRYAIERVRTREVMLQQATAIAASKDGIVVLNANREFTYVNQAFAQLYGYSDTEKLLGKPFDRLYPNAELQRFKAQALTQLKAKGYWSGEAISRRQTGETFYQELSVTSLRDGGYVCIVRDISDRKRAELERKKAEESLKLTQFSLDRVSDAVFLTRSDARFFYVNDAACRLLGYSQQELLNLTVFDVDPNFSPDTWANHWQHLKQQRFVLMESVNSTKDGRTFPVETSTNYFEFNGEDFKCTLVRDISARKAAAKALEASERKFRTLVSNVPGVIYRCLHDARCTSLFVSNEIESLTGYPATDFTDKRVRGFANMIHPDDFALTRQSIDIALAEKHTYVLEYRMIHRDGSIRWVYEKGQGIWAENGDLMYLDGVIFDVSDRKQAEAQILHLNQDLKEKALELGSINNELSKTQEFLSAVLDAASDPIFVKDEQHRWILLNQKLCDFFGYPREVLLGHSDYDFFPKEQADVFWEKDNEVLTTGETNENEEYITDAAKNLKFISTKKSRLVDASGNKYIVAILRDLTRRRQMEEALRQSEERFRQLAENIDDVFWMEEPHANKVLYVSNAYDKIWGRDRTDLYTSLEPLFQSIHPQDRDRYLDTARQPDLQTYDIQYRIVRLDGEIRWIRDRAFHIYNDQGELYRLAGIASDITQTKQAEAEVLRALAQEKELNELKSRFITTASHEFRTPLTTILGSTELLEAASHKWTDEKKQKHYGQIKAAVQYMTQLLEDILTFSKAEVGKLPFNPTIVDAKALCLGLVEELQALAKTQQKIIFTDRGNCCTASLDEKLLRQILTNLLSNALKYSPENGIAELILDCDDNTAIFQIRDQGIGIPEADLQHLFDPFHRANNVGTIAGTGLGLAIVKRAVDAHHGEILVESHLGMGTLCTVRLPLHLPPIISSSNTVHA
jgi:PAS domain S-box-containing protein